MRRGGANYYYFLNILNSWLRDSDNFSKNRSEQVFAITLLITTHFKQHSPGGHFQSSFISRVFQQRCWYINGIKHKLPPFLSYVHQIINTRRGFRRSNVQIFHEIDQHSGDIAGLLLERLRHKLYNTPTHAREVTKHLLSRLVVICTHLKYKAHIKFTRIQRTNTHWCVWLIRAVSFTHSLARVISLLNFKGISARHELLNKQVLTVLIWFYAHRIEELPLSLPKYKQQQQKKFQYVYY